VFIGLRTLNKDRRMDLRDGVVLDGFPSVGLVNAIAFQCLVRSVGTELVAILDSSEFPSCH
jgi:uncharacterized protein